MNPANPATYSAQGMITTLKGMQTAILQQADAAGLWDSVRRPVDNFFTQLDRAITAIELPAKKVAELLADRRLAGDYRSKQINTLMVTARTVADAALAAAADSIKLAANESLQAMKPGHRRDVTQADILDRKADLQRILDTVPSENLGGYVAQLVAKARATQADATQTSAAQQDASLTAYTLTNAMDLYLSRDPNTRHPSSSSLARRHSAPSTSSA